MQPYSGISFWVFHMRNSVMKLTLTDFGLSQISTLKITFDTLEWKKRVKME